MINKDGIEGNKIFKTSTWGASVTATLTGRFTTDKEASLEINLHPREKSKTSQPKLSTAYRRT